MHINAFDITCHLPVTIVGIASDGARREFRHVRIRHVLGTSSVQGMVSDGVPSALRRLGTCTSMFIRFQLRRDRHGRCIASLVRRSLRPWSIMMLGPSWNWMYHIQSEEVARRRRIYLGRRLDDRGTSVLCNGAHALHLRSIAGVNEALS